jgi:UDP-3-O-[3-hydroxymyristoyl] glucosamine N-acyltransferase
MTSAIPFIRNKKRRENLPVKCTIVALHAHKTSTMKGTENLIHVERNTVKFARIFSMNVTNVILIL